ncbi:MAG TPA: hypothetical protein VFA95_13745 [Gammaproteobacteria bacterium]|nr:hypothetical protein [Gammaproteobacteria bacterium]
MAPLRRLRSLLALTRSRGIVRRYFVVNGFDGALTMLGLIIGFHAGGGVPVPVALGACAGAAIALAVSGVTSAYLSETAERRRELAELESAMATRLDASALGRAARVAPMLVSAVNGLAPLVISLVIMLPLVLARAGWWPPGEALHSAIAVAFAVIFLLGVFLGRVGGVFWLWSGLRTLAIGGVTALVIFLLGHALG